MSTLASALASLEPAQVAQLRGGVEALAALVARLDRLDRPDLAAAR